MGKKLNADYAVINGMYWMFYSVAAIYVSVYMLAKGYSNTTIGMVIAIGNVMSVLAQAVLSNLTDQEENFTNFKVLKILVAVLFACTAAVFLIGQKCFVLTFCYTLLIIAHTTMHPFANSLSFNLEECGIHINFGLCRATGSFTAAVICTAMGSLVTIFSEDVIPGAGMCMVALIGFSILLAEKHCNKYKNEGKDEEEKESSQKVISMAEFFRRNKRFLLMSLGVVALFVGNVILENFVMQIIVEIGGDTGKMGIITGLGAACEIPAMLFFDKIKEKFSYIFLLRMSTVFFVVKILMFLFAKSTTLICLAQLNQILGYGIMLPAMVGFIDYIMEQSEAVRGQMIFTTSITAGQVIGMVFGGIVLDALSVHALLQISTAITIAGAILICMTVKPKKKNLNRKEV